MQFIITIDTEADNQWDKGRKLTTENIKFIPRFQDLCARYMIKPTYLVTSEVCEDAFSKELFSHYLLNDKAEIGAHLHSWTTPPFQDIDGYRFNDPNHAFATELPEDFLKKKIFNLTSQIETSFGKRPSSFRSGRFGFNRNVARILMENSYLVDSSVTPYVSWSAHKGISESEGGPDFLENSVFPYLYNFDSGSLIEMPVTILPTRFPLNRVDSVARYFLRNVNKSLILRGLRHLFFSNQPLWLRPFPYMNNELIDEVLNEAIRIKLPFIVMMFHSSELLPGGSIYRSNDDSVNELFDLLDRLFALLSEKSIEAVTLSEAAKNYGQRNIF